MGKPLIHGALCHAAFLAPWRLEGATLKVDGRKATIWGKGQGGLSKKRQAPVFDDIAADLRAWRAHIEKRPELLTDIPELLCRAALEYFTVDGRPKRDVQSAIIKRIFRNKGVRRLIKSELTLGNVISLFKGALKGAIKYKNDAV